MTWKLLLRPKEAREYGRRAQPARKAYMQRWNVEGEMVSVEDIGKRIKLSAGAAANRLRREQAKPGPVTWAGLNQQGNKQ